MRRSMHTTTNVLLVNVAASDIVSLFFCVPGIVMLFVRHPGGNLGTLLCKLVTMHHIAGVSLLVSGLTLTLISVERHNALLRAVDLRLKLAKHRVLIAIPTIWVFSIAFVSPLFIEQEFVNAVQSCYLDWTKASSTAYWVCLATLVVVSLIVLCFCYIRIVKALYINDILPPNNNDRSAQDTKDKRKLIKLLLMVTGLFVVCFLPYVVVSAVGVSTRSALYRVSYFLVYCSCCVNPVVYVFQSANYRAGVKELWNTGSIRRQERSLES